MQCFEYKQIMTLGEPVKQKVLEEMGAIGWELVSVISTNNRLVYYFKRKKES
jgi:hypothetical protein